MSFLLKYPELLSLAVNVAMVVAFVVKGDWAKVTYWAGAMLITLGLLQMRGA